MEESLLTSSSRMNFHLIAALFAFGITGHIVTGVLYRIFLNVLLTAAVVTLTAWVSVLVGGFALFVGLPLFCGFTGRDFESVFRHVFG